jgi:nucleotide-binding universal stress UspA family protein
MYKRIILAYDGSVEGRMALREGALMAKQCGAAVFLLSASGGSAGVNLAEGTYAGVVAHRRDQLKKVFNEGVARLTQLGMKPHGKLVEGDPSEAIRIYAAKVDADLVVVGHRRRSLLERWWSGSSGAYLSDHIGCSLLISRNTISDDQFARAMDQSVSS